MKYTILQEVLKTNIIQQNPNLVLYLFKCFEQITSALQWLLQTEADFTKLISQHTEEIVQISSFPIEQLEQEAEKIVFEYALTKNTESQLKLDTLSKTNFNRDFQPGEKNDDFISTRVLTFLNNLKHDYEAYKLRTQSNDIQLEKRIQRLQEYIISNTQPK